MIYTQKTSLSWDDVANDCADLAETLKNTPLHPYTKMLAITRGGLSIASLLSRCLNIQRIETISLSSYKGQQQTEAIQNMKPASDDFLHNTLIVDDLVDTGKTFEYMRTITKDCTFCCLYAKPKGEATTDFFVKRFMQNQWIEFPWEKFEPAS